MMDIMSREVIRLNCPLWGLLEFRMFLSSDGHLIASNAFCRHINMSKPPDSSRFFLSALDGNVLWSLFKSEWWSVKWKWNGVWWHHPRKQLLFTFVFSHRYCQYDVDKLPSRACPIAIETVISKRIYANRFWYIPMIGLVLDVAWNLRICSKLAFGSH